MYQSVPFTDFTDDFLYGQTDFSPFSNPLKPLYMRRIKNEV